MRAPVLLATLLALHSRCTGAPESVPLSPRVSRGTTVPSQSIPTWYAVMHVEDSYSYGTVLCGAFRIDDTHALTAAHCLETRAADGSRTLTDDIMLFFGDELRPTFATRAIVHTHYSGHPFYERDIALLDLSATPAAATGKVALATDGRVWEEVVRNRLPLQSLGLGVDATGAASTSLKWVQLPAVPAWECIGTDDDQWPAAYVHGDLCAGHMARAGTCTARPCPDVCRGDSGSPLFVSNDGRYWSTPTVVGIVSRGESPCGQGQRPGLFTDVADHAAWIASAKKGEGALSESEAARRHGVSAAARRRGRAGLQIAGAAAVVTILTLGL